MHQFTPIELSLATVREYQEALDAFPQWANLRAGDVKSFQWPWAITRVLRHVPKGSTLLEYGAGDCAVAGPLSRLGYRVTAVDPYEGNDGGPKGFERSKAAYPEVEFVAEVLSETSPLPHAQYDAVVSVSVLEHVPIPAHAGLATSIIKWLKPGGLLIDAIDFTVRGKLLMDFPMIDEVLHLRGVTTRAETLAAQALADPDTYYLSAAAHRSWRGKRPYDEYPFRQVTSVNVVARLDK